MVTTWRNWGRTQKCTPSRIGNPASGDEICSIVRDAYQSGEKVKAIGSGHSFTDIACTTGRMLRLDGYNRILEIDAKSGLVTVQSGISIAALSEELSEHGLALENQGDVAYQTISGAISTATHGTGAKIRNISSQVRGLSLVLADGSVLRCSPTVEPDVFESARVSLGALGVISTVTLQCVPAFALHSIEEPRNLEDVLGNFDELAGTNDHFEFFWFPHTERAHLMTNNRTDRPVKPKGRASAYINDIVLENHAFGLVQDIGHARRAWVPGLARFTAGMLSRNEVVDSSHRVFANERLVRFAEMEYAIPRAQVVDAVREVKAMIERTGMRISFPVEVRVVAPDDIPLSTAFGRPTGYIAVHVYYKDDYVEYFREVEKIMAARDGRPHWGKLHFRDAASLRPVYPRWDGFMAVRERLDPQHVFGNAYLERVLGR
jgi:L-gulono-1,4-lactone dehydrogenase